MRQGCVLAPSVIKNIMRRLLHRCSHGKQLGEYQPIDLDYVDDIAIFVPPPACVCEEALTLSHERANLGCMQIGWPSPSTSPTISFIYLGFLVTGGGASPPTIHLALPRLIRPGLAYQIQFSANNALAHQHYTPITKKKSK